MFGGAIMETKTLTVNEVHEMIDEIDIKEYPMYINLFKKDTRKAIQKLGSQLDRQYNKYLQEIKRIESMKAYEKKLYHSGCQFVAGIDEVGRGPLAGPVVAAAVVLPKDYQVLGINDSKKIPEKKREALAEDIHKHARAIGIGIVDREIIDEINILNATKRAMREAIEQLSIEPDHILIDALTLDGIETKQTAIIKGDQKSISIAAASIIAKVTRDRMMCDYHEQYPYYDFISNKGYGTKNHYLGIERYGVSPLHRRSFLKDILKSKI